MVASLPLRKSDKAVIEFKFINIFTIHTYILYYVIYCYFRRRIFIFHIFYLGLRHRMLHQHLVISNFLELSSRSVTATVAIINTKRLQVFHTSCVFIPSRPRNKGILFTCHYLSCSIKQSRQRTTMPKQKVRRNLMRLL